jgi:hypothetical protein
MLSKYILAKFRYGKEHQSKGKISAQFKIQGLPDHQFKEEFTISLNLSYEVILVLPFLTHQQALVGFAQNRILIHDSWVNFSSKPISNLFEIPDQILVEKACISNLQSENEEIN